MSGPEVSQFEKLLSKSFTGTSGGLNPKAVNALIGAIGHSGFLGIDYVDHGTDWVELSMDWRDDLIGNDEYQLVSSSAVITMINNACSLAVWTKLGFVRPQVLMDLRVDYLGASPSGKPIYCRSTCYRATKTVGFVRGVVHNGNAEEPVGYANATFRRVADGNILKRVGDGSVEEV